MAPLALVLVLASSVVHATWNLLSKKVNGGIPFIWLVAALATVFYAPLVVGFVLWKHPYIGPLQIAFMLGSGLLRIFYFRSLQKGYRVGDLSVVYPLARGTGATLATLGAILFLSEHPSLLAEAGAMMILGGVFLIARSNARPQGGFHPHQGVRYALLTGLFIAGYTLLEKQGVSKAVLVPPLLLDYGALVTRAVFLAPFAYKRRAEVAEHWKEHRWPTIGVALLSPLAYVLVLVALTKAPVSYVAPMRELSILFGVVFGASLLSEGNVRARVIGAVLMMAGVTALALSK
jgi:uncharacterized membrane protein